MPKKKTKEDVLEDVYGRQRPFPKQKEKKKKKKGKYGGDIPARKEVPANPHGVTKKDQDGNIILMAKDGGSASKFGMLSVKAGIDNNPNPTQADRIAGATKKMKRGGKVTGRSMGPAGASIVSDDGKRIKQLKKIQKSLLPLDAASVGAVSAIKGLGKLAGRLAKRGYGKARK